MAEHTSLNFEQIKALFPNEWVLLGNPVIENAKVLGGVVIFHSSDKREIAYKNIDWRKSFSHATTIFTGEILKSKKFWL